MDCSICKLTGITKGALLCPRCGSLVEREEIIYAEGDRRGEAENLSILKGKVVELAAKKDRFEEKIGSQKLMIYVLFFCLLGSILFRFFQKPRESAEALRYKELKEVLVLYAKEVKELREEVREANKLGLQEPPPVKEEVYTVKEGDNLIKIANEIYGDPEYFKEIASVNGLVHPYHVKSGDELILKRD